MKTNLNTFPIFSGISDEEVKLFTSKLILTNFKKNDTIISEGQEGHSLLFVIEGEIIISKALTLATNKIDENDTREKQLTSLNSNDHKIMIGEIALFSPDKKRNATVKAIVDCKIAILPFDKIFEICNSNHSLDSEKYIQINDNPPIPLHLHDHVAPETLLCDTYFSKQKEN